MFDKPSYHISNTILHSILKISEKLGQVNARFIAKPNPQLRKSNRIKTIHSSLKIEGNSLSIDQVAGVIENKSVLGPAKDILEVENALKLYQASDRYSYKLEKHFLNAHKVLMNDLISDAGKYRNKGVGILKGDELTHVAPSAEMVPRLVQNLFSYLSNSDDPYLIKATVFHYEIEFIHPFSDGNGRMGRFWQSLILSNFHPVFQYLPIESIISEKQDAYYKALADSDKAGNSTLFIEFMLEVIHQALASIIDSKGTKLTELERLEYFLSSFNELIFSRKDYLIMFKDISTASASRDLAEGVKKGLIIKEGDKRLTTYRKVGF